MTSGKHQTWQDIYYDGLIDEKYEGFCEDTQTTIRLSSDGWDKYDEDYDDEDEYWESLNIDDSDWNEMKLFNPNLSDQ